jgi:excisionase family DNA binding protein
LILRALSASVTAFRVEFAGPDRDRNGGNRVARMPITDQMITAQETADYLGVHVKTLRLKWRAWGLPGTYVGRALSFKLSGVERWLETNQEVSQPALSEAAGPRDYRRAVTRRSGGRHAA